MEINLKYYSLWDVDSYRHYILAQKWTQEEISISDKIKGYKTAVFAAKNKFILHLDSLSRCIMYLGA